MLNYNYLPSNILEYSILLIFFFIITGIALVIIFLAYIASEKSLDSEKISSYECGFDPFGDSRHTFDIKFYLVAILFIIFDLEVIYLFP
jgi:NADH-quinone oxidoreductase subunit A